MLSKRNSGELSSPNVSSERIFEHHTNKCKFSTAKSDKTEKHGTLHVSDE